MEGIVVLLIVAAAAAGFVLYRRAGASQRTGGGAPAPRQDPFRSDKRRSDPRRIRVGDVVMFEGRDFIVRGTIAFDQDGFVWHEHLLDDVEIRRWLSVEDDEGEFEAVLWESLKGAEVAEPGGRTVTYDGTAYTLDEHGRARFRAEGNTGTGPTGAVEYYDYAAGEQRLSFERYGDGAWETGRGRVVDEHLLDVYPGSD